MKPREYDFSQGSTNTYVVDTSRGFMGQCLHCKRHTLVKLDGTAYFEYFVSGTKNVQTAFPTLAPDQREMLINGIHPECWDEFIGPEPE